MAANGELVPKTVLEALADVAAEEKFSKPRFIVESGSNQGDGYMSALYRAVIQSEDDVPSANGDSKLHLMCKTMMPATKGNPFIEHIFKIESIMYSGVLPAMEDIASLKQPLPWPRGFRAPVPEAESLPCLVLEDLRPEGFVMAARGAVLDEAHCRLVLSQLARYHAAGMALGHLRPDDVARFRGQMENRALIKIVREHFKTLLRVAESAPDLLTDEYPEGSPIHDKLKKLCSNFAVEYFSQMAPYPDGGNTIVHGDCHVNNVMWQYDKASGAVTGCRLIDYQAARYGYPAPDLVVLLLSGTEKALRDQHWDSLLRGYHAELQATLRAAGCEDPDAIYSWDRFQAQLRRAAPIGLCMTPLMFLGFSDEDAIKEVQDTVAQMTIADAGQPKQAAPAGITLKATPLLKRRFLGVVQSLLEWGWL